MKSMKNIILEGKTSYLSLKDENFTLEVELLALGDKPSDLVYYNKKDKTLTFNVGSASIKALNSEFTNR